MYSLFSLECAPLPIMMSSGDMPIMMSSGHMPVVYAVYGLNILTQYTFARALGGCERLYPPPPPPPPQKNGAAYRCYLRAS